MMAMLQGLSNVEGGRVALPFVSMFYGAPSNTSGRMILAVHTIDQGEGGEQGDALMPLLYSLGQHGALHKLHSEELRDEETLLAFLDDTHVVIPCPDRTTTVYAALQEAMFSTTSIRINPGRSGMQQESNRQGVVCCSALPRRTIPQRWCGEDPSCPRTDKG